MSAQREQAAPRCPASLRHNLDFLLLWWGQVVSGAGSATSQLAFPLLVLAITRSPAEAGVLGALRSIPPIVLLLPAGALVDRWDRKRTMILSDAGRALAMGSIPVALALGHVSLWQLAAVSLVEGTLQAFFGVADAACVPQVVAPTQLPRALSVMSVTDHVTILIGPSLGGVLYSAGRAWPFLADAISYTASVVSLLFIKTRFQGERTAPSGSLGDEIWAGLRWLMGQPVLRSLTFLVGGLNLFSMGYPLIMIVRAQQLHATSLAIGLLFATGGLGGIAGSIVAPWFQSRYGTGPIMIVASWVWVVTWVPYALAPTLVWLGLANVVGWLIIPIHTVTQSSYRLTIVPDELRGRINAVYRLIAYGGQPLSYALTGLLLQAWGPVTTVLLIMLPQALVTVLATANTNLRRAPRLAEVSPRR